MQKIRLGFLTAHPSDGRSLSRLFGPFNEMRRENPALELVRPDRTADGTAWDLDWNYFSGLDVVYLLDPCTKQDLAHIALAKACGCKVWVDYIDDLLNVPSSNPSFHAYVDRDGIRAMLAEIIGLADIATCTTYTLLRRLPNNQRVVVLPESCRWPMNHAPRQRCVTWRGLASHNKDLASVLPQIAEVARMPQFSKWEWAFLGDPNPDIYEAIPSQNLLTVPAKPPYDFMSIWGDLAPFLHIAPIIDIPFNRAKTPLVWLEATAVGAAVIGPSLAEWRNCAGLMPYQDPKDFGEILKRELFRYEEGGAMHPNVALSRADVYPEKTSRYVNAMRWAVLEKLMQKPAPCSGASLTAAK